MGLFQAGVLIAIFGVAYVFFCSIAIVVVVRALGTKARRRYLPALFAGLAGHAIVPLGLSLVYAFSGRWRLLDMFYDTPMGFINGALLALDPSATKLNAFFATAAQLGFHVGFFAFAYLILTLSSLSPSQKAKAAA